MLIKNEIEHKLKITISLPHTVLIMIILLTTSKQPLFKSFSSTTIELLAK